MVAGVMDVTSLHSILPEGEVAPEWVHLIPGGTFSGEDGRGPYTLENAESVIAASLKPGKKLVFDQDHSTDHALRTGAPAPARGWIAALQARADGIWGQVEWTEEGRRMLASREYRGVSPAFTYDPKTGRVTQLLRASLTNAPNLDLPALHNQDHRMDILAELRTVFGLPGDADAEAALAAARAARSAIATHAQQLQSIASAAKLDPASGAAAIATALGTRSAGAGTLEEVTALQSRIVELENGHKRRAAEVAIDAAMREGKPILDTRREEFIARHMADPAGTAAWLADMPSLASGGVPFRGVVAPTAANGIDGGDAQVIALMGLDPDAFRKAKEAVALSVAAGAAGFGGAA